MKNNYLPIILTATAFGLIAGVTGALFANLYNTGNGGALAFNRELNLSNYGALASNLVIRDAKKVVVNQDVKTDETIRDLRASLLSVFVKEEGADVYYELSRPFAQALAATTDGWIMAAWPQNLSEVEAKKVISEYVVIDSSRKVYEIDQVLVSPDKVGAFVFLHLKNASSLNVRRLVPDVEIKTGQSLLLATGRDSFLLNALGAKVIGTAIASSDVYPQELSLAYAEASAPAFVFNLSGEVIGAFDWQGQWLVAPELDTYWRSLLKTRSLAWPVFGVNYLNLAAVAGNEKFPEKGALLQNNVELPAVLKNGPADKAGLKAGDIITRLNGVEINVENDLALLLSSYNPGDSVNVSYSRGGNNLQTEVVLGSDK